MKKWEEVGKIGARILNYAKKIAKKDMLLLELAERVEKKAEELKVGFAFPINLSCDEIAAHFSPQTGDGEVAKGFLKIDIGIKNEEGYISDNALTLDLENKNKKLLESSRNALNNAIKIIKKGVTLGEIGKTIQETITSDGFSSIRNLSGHKIEKWKLHSGLTIPNYDNHQNIELEEGIYAIEPFATTGNGLVQDGKESGIYILQAANPVRNSNARKIFEYIVEKHKTLPFSKRWIIKKFGTKAAFSLRLLERNDNLHHFKQLVEKSRMPVSQAEHTLLLNNGKVKILTLDE